MTLSAAQSLPLKDYLSICTLAGLGFPSFDLSNIDQLSLAQFCERTTLLMQTPSEHREQKIHLHLNHPKDSSERTGPTKLELRGEE